VLQLLESPYSPPKDIVHSLPICECFNVDKGAAQAGTDPSMGLGRSDGNVPSFLWK